LDLKSVKSNELRHKNGEDPTKAQIAEAVGMGLEEYDSTLRRLESSKQPSNHVGFFWAIYPQRGLRKQKAAC
jgi:DNA-directed RNA polymerase specialized sigma subunit